MPRRKSQISVFSVIFNGLKTYLNNLDIFLKYLSFPVLGTVLGIFLLFYINYIYLTHFEQLETYSPIFSSPAVLYTILLIITVPAFAIIIKALIDYVIAFGALNSMCVNANRIEDVYYHKETVKRRFAPYCVLIIVLSIIFGVLSFPLFLPLLFIALIFLSLTVQIYILEENISPYESIRKSIELVKPNFWMVFIVTLIITFISYIAIPYLICWAIGKTTLIQWLSNPVEKYIMLLPVNEINTLLAAHNINYTFDVIIIAENIVYSAIATMVIMFMLPFRCACCVELYKGFIGKQLAQNNLEEEKPKKQKQYKKDTRKKRNGG